MRQGDDEKRFEARVWLNDLKSNPSILAGERNRRATGQSRPVDDQSSPANNGRRRRGVSPLPPVDDPPAANPPASAAPPPVLTPASAPVAQPPTGSPAPVSVPPPAPTRLPPPPAAPPAAPMPAPLYGGAKSGMLTCTGAPVPQNAEYVFRDLPLVTMRLDYDAKIWDAHLSPGIGQTQKLILRNKSPSPQKRCEVRWSVIQ